VAAAAGAQVTCLQELFFCPYFCTEQNARWFDWAETIPGPTTDVMQEAARKHSMALVAPIFEREDAGVYYNTAVVIDADGTLLGRYRKNHIPQMFDGWEKFYFRPGNLGYPVFSTRFARIGVLICYDRHYPEGARMLGLHGAQIVYIPSATTPMSSSLWQVEQRAHAIANRYFVGAINRVGIEEVPVKFEFYGSSYFCGPDGDILSRASDKEEAVLVADLDLDAIEAARIEWQFYRDRRPDTYSDLVAP
jgi:beta-ureidopropionase